MRNRGVAIVSALLLLTGESLFFLIPYLFHAQNGHMYHAIVEKMKDGGQMHLILPEIDRFLNRSFLDDDTQNNALLLAAFIHYRKGNYREADRFFSRVTLDGKLNTIRDYIDYGWAKALMLSHRKGEDPLAFKQAATFFKNVAENPDSPMKKKAFSEYIKALYYSGDETFLNTLSEDDLTELTGSNSSELPEWLFILGDAYGKAGNRDKSLDYWTQLWKKYVGTSWASKAANELETAGERARIQYPAISLSELLNIYDSGVERNKSASNLQTLLKKVEEIKPAAQGLFKDKVNLLYGKIYFSLEGKKPWKKSLHYLRQAFHSRSPEIKAQAAYYLVRIYGDDFNFKKLEQAVRGIHHRRFMKTEYFERTAYAAGYPFMRKQQFDKALPLYQMVLKKETSDNRFIEQALWRLHWCYYHLKNYPDALTILKRLEKYDPWKEYALFWTAAINRKIGDEESAKGLYQRIVEGSGFTYYGIVSSEMLKKDWGLDLTPETGKEQFREISGGVIEDATRNARYRLLSEMGLYEFAAQELEAYVREKGISADLNPETWKPYGSELARLYFYSGKYAKAEVYLSRVYADVVLKGGTDIPQWFWEMYYPVFYKKVIDDYSDRFGMERALVYALIRQESVYDPYATSGSGAMGVMQIMPETGRMIHKDMGNTLGIDQYGQDVLYNPEINIPMGIYHMQYQLNQRIDTFLKEKGLWASTSDVIKTALMLAGYNAGIERSFRWITEIKFDNDQEFLDQIDFIETRRYVKSILKHRFFYIHYLKH
ncbi:MAG: transglycosylase SLT domain-containing protein [Candidatus Omnitrophota bacterium]